MLSPDFVSRHSEGRVVTMLHGQDTPKYCGPHLRAKRETYLSRWAGMVIAIVVLIALILLIRYLTNR